MKPPRPDRPVDQLRQIAFQPGIAPHATGSVLVSFGNTRVICSAMVEDKVPRWMQVQNVPGGWLTAEYSMLPYSTLERKQRDSTRGHLDGRSVEIQRLIGRSLRAVVDLQQFGPRTLWIDCDVLQADGGTRTAAITGGCVACAIAFQQLVADGRLNKNPLKQLVAAVSAGVVRGQCLLDLCYEEDRDAEVDFNVVMTESLEFVEIQGSGEESVFSASQLSDLLSLAQTGVSHLFQLQREAIHAAVPQAAPAQIADLARHFGSRPK
jgi:ribonuclease PH